MYTIQTYTSLQCDFIRSHIRRVRVSLAVTGHLHCWQNGRDLLRATAVTWGSNGHRNESRSAQKVDHGEDISPAAPAGTRTRDLSIESGALTAPSSPSKRNAAPAGTRTRDLSIESGALTAPSSPSKRNTAPFCFLLHLVFQG